MKKTLTIKTETRLDLAVQETLPRYSRNYIQHLIKGGLVLVNKTQVTKTSLDVKVGDKITITLPELPSPKPATPTKTTLDIVYEDSYILVINKPAGMVVHPSVGHETNTLTSAVLAYSKDFQKLQENLPEELKNRPGLIHRLDKDTSGLIILAKTPEAINALSKEWQSREVHKTYTALVFGKLEPKEGSINAPILRHPTERKKMAIIQHGRASITDYKVLKYLRSETGDIFTLLEAYPQTGRTHQIRVHLAFIQHPIVGDPVYSGKTQQKTAAVLGIARQFLHANALEIKHPKTQKTISFTAALPADLIGVLALLKQA